MPKAKWLAMIKATLAVVSWGVTFVATKVALRYISPPAVVWLRFGVGLLLLGLVMVFRGQFQVPASRDWGYFALLGVIGITFHQWLQSTGLVTSQAATTAWIVATTPIFIAILGWIFLKEKVHKLQILGIGFAALGVFLVVAQGNLNNLLWGRIGASGDWLILISAPNWAVFTVLSRYALRKFPATVVIFYVMLSGWIFSTIPFLLDAGYLQFVHLNQEGWIAILFLGVLGSGLAYIFWYDALQVLSATQTGAFVYLEPFVTVIVAAWLLAETIHGVSIAGGLGIIVGIWLVNRPGGS